MKPAMALLGLGALCAFAQVKVVPGAENIAVEIGGKPFTTFVMAGPDVAKPYLFPLRAASGTTITRHWPVVKDVEGEPRDHVHHKGLWFGHGNVNGADFWANEAENKSARAGRIELVKVHSAKGGQKSGTIVAEFHWKTAGGDVLLTESRTMTFHSAGELRAVDFDIRLQPKQKLTFADDKEGTFALRLRPELQESKGTGRIVNADGLEGEKQAWGKPSKWVDYSGRVEEEAVGVAIFDHPGNPRHPNRWHVRAYGLFSLNPFGVAAFTGDKGQTEPMIVDSGQELRYRFRVVIHPGDAKSAGIAALYSSYTKGQLR